jgi:hypothetical protein
MMTKLQDFAAQQNVTERQIYRLLQKYADELQGLYERRGQNGTWLTDEACEILHSKMRQQPVIVSDGSLARQAEELKAKNLELLEELHTVQADMIELQKQNTKLIAETARISLLEADNDVKTQKLVTADEENQQLQAEIEKLRQQLESEKQRPLTLRERFFGRKN